MKAKDHTGAMLAHWAHCGIDRVDLALRRPSGAMLWHRSLALEELPLPWARYENSRETDVYIRPARGRAWPLVFLDDLDSAQARRVAQKYSALVVETSSLGGCHLWLRAMMPLDEASRRDAQRRLAQHLGGDHASTSGEHLGRLAGFKNWKRGGCWVNVLVSTPNARLWKPKRSPAPLAAHPRRVHHERREPGVDRSPSGIEWAQVCAALEAERPSPEVFQRLLEQARIRRGPDAERYARRTILRAIDHVSPPPGQRAEATTRPPISGKHPAGLRHQRPYRFARRSRPGERGPKRDLRWGGITDAGGEK